MDQSGPRHQSELSALIIERPDLAHPFRRILACFFTAVIWCWWLLLWFPVIEFCVGKPGTSFPLYVPASPKSVLALHYLFEEFPIIVGMVLLTLVINFIFRQLYHAIFGVRVKVSLSSHATVTTELSMNDTRFNEWQSARILAVDHNRTGQVVNATIQTP